MINIIQTKVERCKDKFIISVKNMQTNELFEDIIEYPNPEAQERFSALVGLDDVKETLTKEASLLLNPDLI